MDINIQEYINEKKDLYDTILNFLEESDSNEYDNHCLTQLITSQNFEEDQEEFMHLLRLIISISNNHHRNKNFLHNIIIIFDQIKDKIKQTFSK